MSEIATLLNFTQSMVSFMPEDNNDKQLKTLCLYNDVVIFPENAEVTKRRNQFVAEQMDISYKDLSKTFLSVADVLQDYQAPRLFFDGQMDMEKILGKALDKKTIKKYEEEIAAARGLSHKALKNSLKTWGDNYELFKEIYYYKISAISSLQNYEKVNAAMPCSLTGFSAAEQFLQDAYIKKNTPKGQNTTSEKLVNEINLLIPDLDAFSWGEIFELRNDRRIIAFRKWINDRRTDIQDQGIDKVITQEFWKVFEDLKPSVTASSVTGFLGNLPFPFFFNPVAVAASFNEVREGIAFNNQYSWLIFTYDLRKKLQYKRERMSIKP